MQVFFVTCFILLVLVLAETQKQNGFLKDLNSYQHTCRELGWEPKCQAKNKKNRAVAFQVYLKKHIERLSQNQILKYDHVITNIGGGYNATTGKFTAPVDGVYSFSWTYLTKKGTRCYIGGMIDGRQLVWSAIYDQMALRQSTTAHLVKEMKKGSEFWTTNTASHVSFIHSQYTFLTGYKISGEI